jgi:hypothetical protein
MLKVFLSYTKADRDKVVPYYTDLASMGYEPWMDVEKLVPGHNWSWEIDQALAQANVIMIFLSSSSVSKRGFVQREANQAMENLKSKLPSDIYIIPVVLEECEVPPHISERLQFVMASEKRSWQMILRSLEVAAEEQHIISEHGAAHGPFRIFEETLEEDWTGTPGHNIKISYPRFASSTLSEAAIDLSHIFAGRASHALVNNRSKPWAQDIEDSFGNSNNGRWDQYGIGLANENFLSIWYAVGWYGAGAAHPNSHFECHNFVIKDAKVYPLDLHELFSDWPLAEKVIVEGCIKSIQREYWERVGEFPNTNAMEWIETGTKSIQSDRFVLTPTGLTFFFSPYEVGPYAVGSFSADIPFQRFKETATPEFQRMLNLHLID